MPRTVSREQQVGRPPDIGGRDRILARRPTAARARYRSGAEDISGARHRVRGRRPAYPAGLRPGAGAGTGRHPLRARMRELRIATPHLLDAIAHHRRTGASEPVELDIVKAGCVLAAQFGRGDPAPPAGPAPFRRGAPRGGSPDTRSASAATPTYGPAQGRAAGHRRPRPAHDRLPLHTSPPQSRMHPPRARIAALPVDRPRRARRARAGASVDRSRSNRRDQGSAASVGTGHSADPSTGIGSCLT